MIISHTDDELLRKCIVQIFVSEQPDDEERFGFFVAPNRVLTCFHVITVDGKSSEIANDIKIQWGDQRYPAQVEGHKAKLDLALLSVELADHPSLPLNDDVFSFEVLHAPGHTDPTVKGFAQKALVEEEKIVLEKGRLEKGKDDIEPGDSGTPLFHPRTRSVCGFISGEADKTSEFKAVHIQTALKIFPELVNQRDNIQNPSSNTIKVCFVHNNDEASKAMFNELVQSLRNLHLTNIALSLHWEDFAKKDEWWEADLVPWPGSEQRYLLSAFDAAHILLLLVSADFHDNNAYYKDYVQQARERDKSGKARAIQVLPPNVSPVPGWPQESIAIGEFPERIREIIEGFNSSNPC